MATVGWHPMTPHLKRRPNIVWPFAVLVSATMFSLLAISFLWRFPITLVEQPLELAPKLATTTINFELAPEWPSPEIELVLSQPSWRQVSTQLQASPVMANDFGQNKDNVSPSSSANNIKRAVNALANNQPQLVLDLLTSDETNRGLALRAAALQQLNAHHAVVELLANKPMTAQLHLRQAVSYDALEDFDSALFHYLAVANQPAVPAELMQFARARINALGGKR